MNISLNSGLLLQAASIWFLSCFSVHAYGQETGLRPPAVQYTPTATAPDHYRGEVRNGDTPALGTGSITGKVVLDITRSGDGDKVSAHIVFAQGVIAGEGTLQGSLPSNRPMGTHHPPYRTLFLEGTSIKLNLLLYEVESGDLIGLATLYKDIKKLERSQEFDVSLHRQPGLSPEIASTWRSPGAPGATLIIERDGRYVWRGSSGAISGRLRPCVRNADAQPGWLLSAAGKEYYLSSAANFDGHGFHLFGSEGKYLYQAAAQTDQARHVGAGRRVLEYLQAVAQAAQAAQTDQAPSAQTDQAPSAQANRAPTVGAKYGTRDPHTCNSTKEPSQGAISVEQAKQYFFCGAERVLDAVGRNGTYLYLKENVKIEVGKGVPYQPGANFYPDMDQSSLVYPIRGSFVTYQCWAGSDGRNCASYDTLNASGSCYRTAFGDWSCTMSGSEGEWRFNVAPPPK
jgi:hypothetical protein